MIVLMKEWPGQLAHHGLTTGQDRTQGCTSAYAHITAGTAPSGAQPHSDQRLASRNMSPPPDLQVSQPLLMFREAHSMHVRTALDDSGRGQDRHGATQLQVYATQLQVYLRKDPVQTHHWVVILAGWVCTVYPALGLDQSCCACTDTSCCVFRCSRSALKHESFAVHDDCTSDAGYSWPGGSGG